MHSDSEVVGLCEFLGVECFSRFPASLSDPGNGMHFRMVLEKMEKSELGMKVIELRKELGF